MKATGCDEVLTEVLVTEAERADQPRNPAAPPARHIAGTRIGTPNVRAERTAQPFLVAVVGEPVACYVEIARSHSADRLRLRGNERVARHLSPDHGLCKFDALGIVASLRRQEAPESAHVLGEFAHDQIAAVAAEIVTRGIILRDRQHRSARLRRIEQRPIGVEAVLVAITQQEFPRRQQIAIVAIGRRARLAFAAPVHARLTDAISEAEWFLAAHVARVQPVDNGKSAA